MFISGEVPSVAVIDTLSTAISPAQLDPLTPLNLIFIVLPTYGVKSIFT